MIEQPATGRRRSKCAVCSPPDLRKRTERRVASVPPAASGAVVQPGEVERSLRAELERAGRVDRYQGVLAIRLAKQLDSATSVSGAQGLASQIDALMAKALDGVAPPADFVDVMAEKRAQVRGAG